MAERLATARSGATTVYLENAALHSAYDPVAEADRFAASLIIPEGVRTLILVEPGLGYLTASLRLRLPAARIIAIHCASFFQPKVLVERADAEWNPSEEQSCESFLEDNLEDREAVSSQVIEWRPAAVAYGEAARDVLRSVSIFLKRAAANESTVRALGRRWFRNAVRNVADMETALEIRSGDAPVVVAVAGPGLEERLDEIRRARSAFPCAVIAVSSAASALLCRGIIPDMVVASDGGGWAAFHLFETGRVGLPLAAALVAELPSTVAVHPVLTLCDGSLWQRVLLSALDRPFVVTPQRGTVTATAIDLAFAATSGSIYVAGMDLATTDIRTHARPYALDRFREDAASRFRPEYCAAYERSGMIRDSSALDVYAAWFAEKADRYAERLVSLGSTHPALAAIPQSERIGEGGGHTPALTITRGEKIPRNPRRRRITAIDALLGALEAEGGDGPLERELAALLGRDGVSPGPRAAEEAVLRAAKGLA